MVLLVVTMVNAMNFVDGLDGLAADPLAQRIEPPEGTRQAPRRPGGPQVGDGREPELVHERDEPGGHARILGGTPHAEQGGGRLVGRVQLRDRVGALAERLEGVRSQHRQPQAAG